MNVVIFGATGMIGGGALLECLDDPDVKSVIAVGRSRTGVSHPKLSEVALDDLTRAESISDTLRDCDACFFCMGVSSVGLTEAEYHRITFDVTLAVARALPAAAPNSAFVYISGAGADSTEKGSQMWARVKGKTENALLALGFRSLYLLRPGLIQPVRGVRSKTGWYQAFYTVMRPFSGLIVRLAPSLATTTSILGKGMLRVAKKGYPKQILESRDINTAGA
jgi:uncharacterized protein YbjT (DUF2867 family)